MGGVRIDKELLRCVKSTMCHCDLSLLLTLTRLEIGNTNSVVGHHFALHAGTTVRGRVLFRFATYVGASARLINLVRSSCLCVCVCV